MTAPSSGDSCIVQVRFCKIVFHSCAKFVITLEQKWKFEVFSTEVGTLLSPVCAAATGKILHCSEGEIQRHILLTLIASFLSL